MESDVNDTATECYKELLHGLACGAGVNSRTVVRKLLPRMRKIAESLEGVVIGKQKQVKSVCILVSSPKQFELIRKYLLHFS